MNGCSSRAAIPIATQPATKEPAAAQEVFNELKVF
jgi:hypothetical protein